MALFNRVSKAAISPPPGKAAAASGAMFSPSEPSGAGMVGQYWSYFQGYDRQKAVSVPAVSRAIDLMKSVVSVTPLRMFGEMWDEASGDIEEIPLAPRSWLKQPDPTVPYSFMMGWTLDDLFFTGSAYWYITEREKTTGRPAAFSRLPSAMVTLQDQPGAVRFGKSKAMYFQGNLLNPDDVVQFLSPIQGILLQSPNVVNTALKLEAARYRNASSAIPAGVLKQTGGEPLSAQELSDLAAAFNQARATNQTAALNQYVDYQETKTDPSKMQLMEAANYQALEIARLCNIPPYLVGVSTGAYSYQSAQQARVDLYAFGVAPYLRAMEETLSSDQVLPRGTFVKFDINSYLAENYLGDIEDPSYSQEEEETEMPEPVGMIEQEMDPMQ